MRRGWLLIAMILLVLAVLALIGGWAMRNQALVKQIRSGWLAHPWVRSVHKRVAPRLHWVRNRLPPAGVLGLQIIIGAATLVAASWIFGGIAEDVVAGDPITEVDLRVAHWLHKHSVHGLTVVMIWISNAHSAPAIVLVTVLIGAFLVWKRDRYGLLELLLIIPGGMLVNVLTKHAFHRTRPQFDDPILLMSGYSFPSGHATAAVLIYGLLAAVIVPRAQTWRLRVFAILCAVGIVLLVGFSRMYLGVHYLTDVLAGYAEAIAWLALCLTAVSAMRERRHAKGP
jgi:membrane-associated phospholipid phosphatase